MHIFFAFHALAGNSANVFGASGNTAQAAEEYWYNAGLVFLQENTRFCTYNNLLKPIVVLFRFQALNLYFA